MSGFRFLRIFGARGEPDRFPGRSLQVSEVVTEDQDGTPFGFFTSIHMDVDGRDEKQHRELVSATCRVELQEIDIRGVGARVFVLCPGCEWLELWPEGPSEWDVRSEGRGFAFSLAELTVRPSDGSEVDGGQMRFVLDIEGGSPNRNVDLEVIIYGFAELSSVELTGGTARLSCSHCQLPMWVVFKRSVVNA